MSVAFPDVPFEKRDTFAVQQNFASRHLAFYQALNAFREPLHREKAQVRNFR